MGIGFISGGSGIVSLNGLQPEQIKYLVKSINELNNLADYIIIDTGAGISEQVLEFVMTSPEIILVTTPEPTSLTDSYSLLKTLFKKNFVECLYKDADSPAFGYSFVRFNCAPEIWLRAVQSTARTQTGAVFTLSGLSALELNFYLKKFYPSAKADHFVRLNG